jgi:hypothetical protein
MGIRVARGMSAAGGQQPLFAKIESILAGPEIGACGLIAGATQADPAKVLRYE